MFQLGLGARYKKCVQSYDILGGKEVSEGGIAQITRPIGDLGHPETKVFPVA